MKYYLIAGEASGDLHASNLIKQLKHEDPQADFRGWGGDLMRESGCEIVRHYKDTAIMGFLTVLRHLKTIKKNMQDCCDDISRWQPDVVILVDYGGFNLRIAKYAKARNFKVFYYIAPKLWAWNTGRAKQLRKNVDKVYVIFPFEVEFFKKYGVESFYGGNPLVDAIANRPNQNETFGQFIHTNGLPDRPIIALLAGSRSQELKHVLPKMLEMVDCFRDYQFVIAGAPSMDAADYAPYLSGHQLPIVYGQTYQLLRHAHAALVTSGTATLETALLNTPQVVCYSSGLRHFSYLMFKIFVKVKFISLVNLIAGREVVRELMMQKLNKKALQKALSAIVNDPQARKEMLTGYAEIQNTLGEAGASRRFAKRMTEDLKPTL